MDLKLINEMSCSSFVNAFGGMFQYSPWVAEKVWDALPAAILDEFYGKFLKVLKSVPRAQIIKLLCLYSDLGSALGDIHVEEKPQPLESTSNNSLDVFLEDELKVLRRLNAKYRSMHQFPLVIAVGNYSKKDIFDEFERRLSNTTALF